MAKFCIAATGYSLSLVIQISYSGATEGTLCALVDTMDSYLTGGSARGAMMMIITPPFKLNSFCDLNSGYIKLNPGLKDISACVFETSEKMSTC